MIGNRGCTAVQAHGLLGHHICGQNLASCKQHEPRTGLVVELDVEAGTGEEPSGR